MNADDNDKLWKLLGKARQPSVSPFFARNVLRTIRQEQEDRPVRSFFFRLNRSLHRLSWQLAIAGTCAVALLVTVAPYTLMRHHHRAPTPVSYAGQIVGTPDYEVINPLDELVADEESSLWLDDSVN